jgi:chromosome segregation ATPase
MRGIVHMLSIRLYTLFALIVFISGCSSVYYDTMEKVGIHKRDIMVDRVESARDAQAEAQEQFQSALDQFASVINLEESDLKRAYDSLNHEFEASEAAAEEVTERINKVESVAEDLFEEWQEELKLYENKSLKATSAKKLKQTKQRYKSMLSSMKKAESSMRPVLNTFRDNVLFLKHNLNAQAIGSLRGEFSNLKADINTLINRMNKSIKQSDEFIRGMQSS